MWTLSDTLFTYTAHSIIFPIVHRFDLGSGAAVIRSPSVVTLNEWHDISAQRTSRNGKCAQIVERTQHMYPALWQRTVQLSMSLCAHQMCITVHTHCYVLGTNKLVYAT